MFIDPSNRTTWRVVTQKSWTNVAPWSALCHRDLISPISPSGRTEPTETCGGYTGLNPKKTSSPVPGAVLGCAVKGT